MRHTLLLMLVIGLSGFDAPKKNALPIDISIDSDKSIVKSGDEVYVNIELKNVSRRDVNCVIIASNGVDVAYDYEVRRISGGTATPMALSHPKLSCTFSSRPCTLKPGSISKSATAISRIYDLHEPGQYVIRVSRAISNSGNPKYGVAESNELAITVIPHS